MLKPIVFFALISALALTSVAACAPNQVFPGELTADEQYERGMEHYRAERYRRAMEYFDVFMRMRVADPRMPEVLFTVADIHMERREYVSAADTYQRLVAQYGGHRLEPESRFRICEAYYRLSPRPELDQQYTHAAIAHCASVAQLLPGTEYAQQAAGYVEELEVRLAEKLFRNGEFYVRRRAFDAALVYFEQVLRDYPHTPVAPAALLAMVDVYERIEWDEEAAETRERLLSEYPDSPQARELAGG